MIKYGVEHFSNLEKVKETCLEKYDCENPSQFKEFKDINRTYNNETKGNYENDGRCSMGGGQNSSSGGQGERVIAFGVLIEAVFPERIQAPTAVDAAQRQNIFSARYGPEHA